MTPRSSLSIPSLRVFSWPQPLRQFLVSIVAIGFVTVAAYKLHFLVTTVGFAYFFLVVITSLVYGIWQATFSALIAVCCLNYFFIPPLLSFVVSDVRDWLALASFLISVLLVSRLSSRERKMAKEATLQQLKMGKLYELSRGILLFDLHAPPGQQLVQLISRTFATEDVAVFDANGARLDHEGKWSLEERQAARTTYLTDRDYDNPQDHSTHRIIRIGTTSVGAIAIRGELDPLIANAVASLAALAFDRHRAYENEARAQIAQQAEQLRVAVLDALAHDFKTPLTVIRTASCGLLEMSGLSENQAELAGLIDQESINLNQLCTRLLQTARLQPAHVGLDTEPILVSQLVNDVIAELSSALAGHPIELAIEEFDSPLHANRELLKIILTQYLDNAAKYADPSTQIGITVRESNSELLLSVRNRGPVIKVQDRDRVFDRFYRSPDAARQTPGAGLGLSIVKKAAEAHRGHVWVISTEDEGTTFYLSMPTIHPGGIECKQD
jgi:two-component system sensor histidine kinase KdpD